MILRAALCSAATLAAFAAVATPASARPTPVGAVTVLGNSAARSCYEEAESVGRPNPNVIALCDQAIAREPLSRRDRVATHINRGILRVRSGNVARGIEDFDAAIEGDPTIAEAWFNRGVALMRTAGPEEALPSFNQAVERATNRPALAHFGRAVALEALGNVQGAYADYQRASQLDPDWDRPRAELARFSVRAR
jgi:tetratricopeptide (TPR) repeat protein